MTIICNDQLTLVRSGGFIRRLKPTVYRVGEKSEHNGMPYTVKAFGASTHRLVNIKPLSKEHPRCLYLVIKYRGDRSYKWDLLIIGDTNSTLEPIVFGGFHPNPVFTHYWRKGWAQPLCNIAGIP